MDPVKDGTPRGATLWRSFGHAWDGLVDAAVTQRNMRIHLVAGVLAGGFAAAAPIAASERALILLCTAAVIAAEAANTALEALVDLHGGPPSELGRVAKDAAAGAVLALAFASVASFSVILIAHRADPVARWRGVVPAGLAALGLAVITAALLLPMPWPPRAAGVPVAAGVAFAAWLGACAVSPPGAVVSAALFGVAAGAWRRSQSGEGQ